MLEVRKRFEPGDHAKATAGQNADETGLVASISDNVVTFVLGTSMQEVSQISPFAEFVFQTDPFLTGEAAYETVLGLQEGGIIACAKHLVGK